MSMQGFKALRNALIVTTLFPILWFSVAGLSVVTSGQIEGLEHPLLVKFVYGAFWVTPLLALTGLALGGWIKTLGQPLPRFYWRVLLACSVLWLLVFRGFSLFPN